MTLDAFGLTIRVRGDWSDVIEAVRLDFAWFEVAEGSDDPAVDVLVEQAPVDLDGFGALPAAFVTPRYAVFGDGNRTIVDYRGLATGVVTENTLTVRGEHRETAHEAAYYFLLGRIGHHLDARGLVRVHGLGLAGAGGAVLVLLPSSGGKSTLALQALQHDEGRLLSEDSPVLDRDGNLHPFPLRIAISSVPPAFQQATSRTLPNPSAGEKEAVEVGTFAHRVEATPQPLRHIVVGTRSLGRESKLEERSRLSALLPLITHGVVGVGLYQGLGYAHQRGPAELSAKLLLAARRAGTCSAGLRGARVWQLTLGRDLDQCWAALRTLVS